VLVEEIDDVAHGLRRRPRQSGFRIAEADRALLAAFIETRERQDPVAALAVLREDIRVAMPPNPGLFTGRDAIAGLMAHAYDRSVFGDWKLLPTAANRMPAAASYLRARAATSTFRSSWTCCALAAA
jgi:RNA polymerase sigma-70 factor (ECF subfamily)